MSEYQTVLVPYDFSEHADVALSTATGLARLLGSELHLVHVIQPPSFAYGAYADAAVPATLDLVEMRESAMRSLKKVIAELNVLPPPVIEPHIAEGAGIAAMISRTAQRLDVDLIVMGTHGRTGLAHVFLGSVAERTLRAAPCPVMTVQARSSDDG